MVAICFSFDSCQRLLYKRWQLFLFEIDWQPLTIGSNPAAKAGKGSRARLWICIRARRGELGKVAAWMYKRITGLAECMKEWLP